MELGLLKKIIELGESDTVEFKEARNRLPDNVFESVCAFLNRTGGDIILGVADNSKITGINPNKLDTIVNNLITLSGNFKKLNPPYILFPEIFNIENKQVVYIRIPQSSQVHKVNNIIFDRSSDGDFRLHTHDAVSKLYMQKQFYFSENKIFPYLSFSDFDKNSFSKARNLIRSYRPNHPWLSISDEEMMISAGLFKTDYNTGKKGYSLAAILLLGKEEVISQILPYYKTDAILRIKNLDRYDDRLEVRSNLIEAYDKLLSFVVKYLPDKFYQDGKSRVDLREKIFREVIANILVHREYTNAFQSTLIISNDSVITENANIPLKKGKMEMINSRSLPKNPVLMKFFQQLGLTEELGSGIRNIKKYLNLYSENATFFFEDNDIFKIRILFTVDEAVEKTEKTVDKILILLKKYPTITIKEIQEEIGLSRRGIEYQINKLKENKKIIRVGSDKSGYWELNNTVEKTVDETVEKTEKTVEKILILLKNHPKITIKEIHEKIGLSRRGVEYQIANLKESGQIKRIGSNRNGYWEINE